MKYYSDGWMKGSNPSPYGGGYTITNENGELIRFKDIEQPGLTNNEAEILGIVEALSLSEIGDEVSTDSMCCLTWINGGKSKVRSDLNHLLRKGNDLMVSKNINLMWEGRDFNLAGKYNEEMHKLRNKRNEY